MTCSVMFPAVFYMKVVRETWKPFPSLRCIGMYKVCHNYLDTTILTLTVLYSPCKLVLVLAVFLPLALGKRVASGGPDKSDDR